MRKRPCSLSLILVAGAVAATGPAVAQATACATSNCVFGKDAGGNPNLPQECVDRASPRTLEVRMDDATFSFIPNSIRVEGLAVSGNRWAYQCIRWRKVGGVSVPWHSATEDDTGNSCDTATACSMPQSVPSACEWETGNIDSDPSSTNHEFSVCHYRDNPPALHDFRCRLHAGFPFFMNGQLEFVPEIVLRVNKNAAGDALLSWSGGSASGQRNVFRDVTPDMPLATVTLVLGPTSLTSHTDPASPSDAYYLVMEDN